MKYMFLYPQKKIKVKVPDISQYDIYYTIQFKDFVESLVSERGYNNRAKRTIHSFLHGQVLGCDFIRFERDVFAVVESFFHSLPVLHSFVYSSYFKNLKLLLLDVSTEKINEIKLKGKLKESALDFSPSFFSEFYRKLNQDNSEIDVDALNDFFDKKVNAMFNKLYQARNVGLVFSTKPGQNNRFLLKEFYALPWFDKVFKDKNVFKFIGDDVDVSNFTFVDFYINFACPRIADDLDLLNFYDLKALLRLVYS